MSKRLLISLPKCKELNSELILVLCFGIELNAESILVLGFDLGPHPGPRPNIYSFFGGEKSDANAVRLKKDPLPIAAESVHASERRDLVAHEAHLALGAIAREARLDILLAAEEGRDHVVGGAQRELARAHGVLVEGAQGDGGRRLARHVRRVRVDFDEVVGAAAGHRQAQELDVGEVVGRRGEAELFLFIVY